MKALVLRYVVGLCAAALLAVNVHAGCGDCGGCSSGSGCISEGSGGAVVYGSGSAAAGSSMGGACGPTVTYQPQTVMRSQYVTETRMVPTTTYQQQTRTRMRNVTRRVARVETREQTYTVNVPQTQTRTESYTVNVCVPYTEEVPLHGTGSGNDTG